MYYRTNKLNTKVYQISKKDITELPLADLGKEYKRLAMISVENYNAKRKFLREQGELKFLEEYNKTHEDSYEGDWDFLETEIDAKMGAKCFGLGSEEEKEFAGIVETFAKNYGLSKKADLWFFPQCQRYLVDNLPVIRNATGKISSLAMWRKAWQDDILVAIIAIFMFKTRGVFLASMTSETCRDYNKLVPLVLAAYKRYANIKYAEWEREEIDYLVEPMLVDAMLTEPHDIPDDVIIAARNEALTVKSGENAGSKRSPLTTYQLYPSGSSVLYPMSSLYRHIVCQTWCAHPSNRSVYAVLDTSDWDNTKVRPLISTDAVIEVKDRVAVSSESPW